jgi:hypothetical protein
MERNGFIYGAGLVTVVVEARLREGGTWHGAVSALRRGERVMVLMAEPGGGLEEDRLRRSEVGEDKWKGSENVEDSWREDEARLRKSEDVEDKWGEGETRWMEREDVEDRWRKREDSEDEEVRLRETEMGARENCHWRAAQALCALGAVPVRSVGDVLAHLDDFESMFRRSRHASLFDDAGSEAPPKTNKKRPKVA